MTNPWNDLYNILAEADRSSIGSLEIAFLTVRVMLLRGIFPKLYRRNLPLDVQVNRGVDITSRTITLVETLQINRLSAFWWSCECPLYFS